MPRGSRGGGARGRSGGFGGGARGFSGGYRGTSSRGYQGQGTTGRYSTSGAFSKPSSPKYNTIQSQRPGMGLGLGSALATGMAFGGGSAIAHHALGRMFGQPYQSYPQQGGPQNELSRENTNQLEQQYKANPCFEYDSKFLDCLKDNKDDISKCQVFFNDMVKCQKNFIA